MGLLPNIGNLVSLAKPMLEKKAKNTLMEKAEGYAREAVTDVLLAPPDKRPSVGSLGSDLLSSTSSGLMSAVTDSGKDALKKLVKGKSISGVGDALKDNVKNLVNSDAIKQKAVNFAVGALANMFTKKKKKKAPEFKDPSEALNKALPELNRPGKPVSASITAEYTSILDTAADTNPRLIPYGASYLEKADLNNLPKIFLMSSISEEYNKSNIDRIFEEYPMFAQRMVEVSTGSHKNPDPPGYFQMFISNFNKSEQDAYSVIQGLGDVYQINIAEGKMPEIITISGILMFTDQDPWILYWEELYKNLISLRACAQNKMIVKFKIAYVVYYGYFSAFQVGISAENQSFGNFSTQFIVVKTEMQEFYKELMTSMSEQYASDLNKLNSPLLKVPTSVEAGTKFSRSTVDLEKVTLHSAEEIDTVIAKDKGWKDTVNSKVAVAEAELQIINTNIDILQDSKSVLNSIDDRAKLDAIDAEIVWYQNAARAQEGNISMLKNKFSEAASSEATAAQVAISNNLSSVITEVRASSSKDKKEIQTSISTASDALNSFGGNLSPESTTVVKLKEDIVKGKEEFDKGVGAKVADTLLKVNSLPEPRNQAQQELMAAVSAAASKLDNSYKSKSQLYSNLNGIMEQSSAQGTFTSDHLSQVVNTSMNLDSATSNINNATISLEIALMDYTNSVASETAGTTSPLLQG